MARYQNILTRKRAMIIVAVALVVIIGFFIFGFQEVKVSPASRTLTRLPEQYRLEFERSTQGWLKTPDGKNIISHGVISDPTLLYENGHYRMWFTATIHPYTDKQELGVAYAESEDGLVWHPRIDAETGEPLLLVRPAPGSWDAEGVETPSVVKASDGRYFMYYTGDSPPKGTNSWAIGLAVSEDGLTWTKVSNKPIFEGAGGWEGPFFEGPPKNNKKVGGASEPSVIYDQEQRLFKMWYVGFGTKDSKLAFRVGYATSADGIIWKRLPNPVLEPGENGVWDDVVVSHVNVVHDPNSGYHLFYFGASEANYRYAEEKEAAMTPGSIGHAFSKDGISWEKDANPVLNIVPDTWEAWVVGGPSALIQNNQVKLWYFGSAKYNTYQFHIGFASARFKER